MPIDFYCNGCGQKIAAELDQAGIQTVCPTCGGPIVVPSQSAPDPPAPVEEEIVELVAVESPASAPVALVAAPRPAPVLRSMRCEGCGGTVTFQEGQGQFLCNYCDSRYEAGFNDAGQAVVHTIVMKRLDSIEKSSRSSRDIAQEERLQKKAQNVQDKIDFKFIEFDNGWCRRAGSLAVILWIFGVVVMCFGGTAVALGLLIVGLGVGAFLFFKQAKARYAAEVAQMKQNELEPIYAELRRIGAVLDGGAVAVGYTESTAVPQRYCVCCHKNVVPAKAGGGGTAASMRGANLLITFLTCGMWIPAWFFIEAMSGAQGMAGRALRSGACPDCGTKTLFPARLPA
jgi:DNA-directed RNA polymerase subunit RPC12/RpoP